MNPDFDAVAFDFGGVLTVSPKGFMSEKAAELGLEPDEFMSLILGPLDEDTDHPYHRLERGEISVDELNEMIAQLAPSDAGGPPVALPDGDRVLQSLGAVDEMVQLANDLRSHGYRTAILTNNVREWHGWSDIVDAHNLVDEVIQSWEVGLRKPDPAVYQLTLDRLNVSEPARCLFLDDFEWNIRGAEAVGLTTIHVTDHAVAVSAVRSLLLHPG
ncbi:MAG: HAD family hydrolase [Acidimicrobiales bacterium]